LFDAASERTVPWYLHLALKQLFPTGRRFPFLTAISLLGVALGVAVLIVTVSIMGGFGREIRNMIVDTAGEIQVKGSAPIRQVGPLLELLAGLPEVAGVTPYAEGVVMLLHENRPAFPAVQGIDPVRVTDVVPIERFIRWGSFDDLDDDSIIVSAQLAHALGAYVGATLELYTPLMLEKLRADEVILPREFRVVGLFEIGHNQLDSSLVLVTLRTMQDLYGLGSSVHGINVKLRPGVNEDRAAAVINEILPGGLRAFTWLDANQDFLFILQLEKNLLFFLFLIIVVVAAFTVMSSLLIAVVRKTREIGLLGALGGDARGVGLCFCLQGLFVGVVGTAGGTVLGFALLHFRNDIVRAFAKLTQSEAALVRFYQFTNLPAHTATGDLVAIVASAVLISTLAALLPAWRAARLKPSEALRSE
jgi:lipoprotein-releasing system permease protein